MSANTQFYKGLIQINGINYPCFAGPTFEADENWNVEPIIGNYWAFNYGDGLITPVMSLPMVPLDLSTGIMNPTFLNYFLTRSSDSAHDTTAYPFTYWDGRDGFTGTLKFDAFTISTSKGDSLRMNCRFCIVGAPSRITSFGSTPSWSSAKQLRFNAVQFAGGLANVPWGFNLAFQNAHTPNMPLDGTRYPADWNAGIQSASIQLTCQAADGMPVAEEGEGGPITVNIGGAGAGFTSSLQIVAPRVINRTPHNRNITAPRVMRQYVYQCLGSGSFGFSTPPLTVGAAP